jgi:hypothetical protein
VRHREANVRVAGVLAVYQTGETGRQDDILTNETPFNVSCSSDIAKSTAHLLRNLMLLQSSIAADDDINSSPYFHY